MRLRFGRKLKLPSTRAIKHQMLMLELEDEIGAASADKPFVEADSAALARLRKLKSDTGPGLLASHSRED